MIDGDERDWRGDFEEGVGDLESAGFSRREAESWTLAEMMKDWMSTHPELGDLYAYDDYRKAADALGWVCGSTLPSLQKIRRQMNH